MITLRQDKGSALTYEEVDNNFNSMMGGHNFLHVQDQKPQGTTGGTFTSGAWQTRDLNTVLTNTITGASLSANQITLPTGKYYVEASAPAYSARSHHAKLYDITNSINVLGSNVMYNNETYNSASFVSISGIFILSGTVDVILQHRCQITKTDNGLGIPNLYDVSIFSDIRIWRIGNYVA